MVKRPKKKTSGKATSREQIQKVKHDAPILNSEIAEEVWKLNKNKFLKILSVIGALWTIFIGVGFWQFYEKAIDEVTKKTSIIAVKYAKERSSELIAEQFGNENIKETFHLVAEREANSIIKENIEPSLKNYQQNVDKKVKELSDFIDSTVNNLSNSSNDIVKNLESIKILTEINLLSDYAISQGNADAFEKLKKVVSKADIHGNVMSAALAKILQIKSFYGTNTRIFGLNLYSENSSGDRKENQEIPTFVLLRELKNGPLWQARAKAAILLGERKQKGIAERLLESMIRDNNLNVRKAALNGFSNLTGFNPSDVFGFDSAYRWWNDNQFAVNEGLYDYQDNVTKSDKQALAFMNEGNWKAALIKFDEANKHDEKCIFDSKRQRLLRMIECRMQSGIYNDKDKTKMQESEEHYHSCISNYAKYLLAAYYDYEKKFPTTLSLLRDIMKPSYGCWFSIFYDRNQTLFGNIKQSIFSTNYKDTICYTETKDDETIAVYEKAIIEVDFGTKEYSLLVFYANWCVDCLYMNEIINDPFIQDKIQKKFAYVPIDLTNSKNEYLKRKYNVGPITTIVVTGKGGKIILSKIFEPITNAQNTSGPISKEKFLEFIDAF